MRELLGGSALPLRLLALFPTGEHLGATTAHALFVLELLADDLGARKTGVQWRRKDGDAVRCKSGGDDARSR